MFLPKDGEPRLGPAMRALPNDKWRLFVRLHIQRPVGFGAKNVLGAGFQPKSGVAARVDAHRLLHDPRVIAAIQEECHNDFAIMGPLALKATVSSLKTKSAKRGMERLKAAKMVFDRGGLPAVVEQKRTVEIGINPEQVRRIEALAVQLGLDPARLLGDRLAALPPVIDAEDVAS